VILPLQYLRAFAAGIVVVYHAYNQAAILFGAGKDRLSFGAIGVDIFFILSGFIMMLVSEQREDKPIKFFARRLLRIIPIYWCMIALYVASDTIFGPFGFFRSAQQILYSLALWAPIHEPPVIGVAWTLRFEFTFYVCFAIALVISHRHRGQLAAFGLLVVLALLHYYTGHDPVLEQTRRWSGAFYEFIYGIALYCFWRGNRTFTPIRNLDAPCSLAVILLAVGLSCVFLLPFGIGGRLVPHFYEKQLAWGLPALVVFICWFWVFSRNTLSGMGERLLLHYGDASFTLYLIHFPVLASLRTLPLLQPAWRSVGPAGYTVVAVISSLAFASLFYMLIERPLLRYLKNLFGRQHRALRIEPALVGSVTELNEPAPLDATTIR